VPPSTKRNIALAQVRRPCQANGNLMVEVYALRELQYAKLMLRAQVAERPFFAPARRRATPPDPF
jgi:aminomethyltransferase